MLNVDDLTPEQLRAIAAAAIEAVTTWKERSAIHTGGSIDRCVAAWNHLEATYTAITEAHDAAKKD